MHHDQYTLSGFDAFGDIQNNPTKEIVQELGGKVIQVSTVDVDQAILEMSSQNSSILIHLGVNANATAFQLENFAYNSRKIY